MDTPTPDNTLLSIRRLSTGSVYKLVFVGLLASMIPLGLLSGALAWIGFDTLYWQGLPVTGPAGLIVGLLAGLWVTLAFTAVMGSLMVLGLWLYSRFKPLRLKIRPLD